MKVLVLGSEGFIGKHVSLELGKRHTLTRSDIINNYTDKNYIQIPTTNPDFESIFKSEFDVCVNCTGAAHVGNSIKDPKNDFYLNTVNIFEILNSIKKESPNCKFINISSAAVYGQPKSLPIAENLELNPISPYGFHKKMSEEILEEFSRNFGISTYSLRVFSCYGPGLKKQLFWDTYQKAINNNLKFWGTGNESRDFIFVEDIAKIIEILVSIDFKGHNVMNIASGEETKIFSAVNLLLKKLDIKEKVVFGGEEDPGQPKHWVADVSKLRAICNFDTTSLEVGLEKYAGWLRSVE